MSSSFAELPWLSTPPADFRDRVRNIPNMGADMGWMIQQLAGYCLGVGASGSLSRAIVAAKARGADLAPLASFRLAVLSNATIDFLAECLPAAAARHGVAMDVVIPAFDQVMQEALDRASLVNTCKPDAVLLALDHRWLQLDRPALGNSELIIERALDRLRTISDGIKAGSGAPVMLQTVPAPPGPLFGSFDRLSSGSVRTLIAEVNRRIIDMARSSGNYVVDIAALAERIGTDTWFDASRYFAYKLSFSPDCDLAYVDTVGRVVGAIRGKARKCLVFDLDNTVWGGVIGDDGMDGIKIGQGSPTGEAFLAVQSLALDLKSRGIIIAVSSKNTDAVAREPFRSHPDMLLRESDISVFQANWLDKPSNLESIARTLNIGIDSLVFLDDNGAERAQVRAALPMVAVPELPDDPSKYPWYLLAAGYFEAVSFSAEDSLRAQSYASDAQRAEVLQKSRDLGDYLRSLQMIITFGPFDSTGRQRIAQLINKSNQFNLTTHRYTEADVMAFQAEREIFTLQVRLEDKFGDLGMIGVVICQPTREVGVPSWEIDTWLMSCRVLGRKVEEAMLDKVVTSARKSGISRIIGTYIPTSKNAMVKDHYARLGFQPIESPSGGATRWFLDVSSYSALPLPMAVNDQFQTLLERSSSD